jgi:hypothetical protein
VQAWYAPFYEIYDFIRDEGLERHMEKWALDPDGFEQKTFGTGSERLTLDYQVPGL